MKPSFSGDRPARVSIRHESDLVVARSHARALGAQAGLRESSAEALATAVTELARNIIVHAGCGDVFLAVVDEPSRRGVEVVIRDDGPGISEPDQAMNDGYSTGEGLGLGLPSARRLTDEFELVTTLGTGTTIRMRKWA
jgi:serine/threonine-protein kinase RsbT